MYGISRLHPDGVGDLLIACIVLLQFIVGWCLLHLVSLIGLWLDLAPLRFSSLQLIRELSQH